MNWNNKRVFISGGAGVIGTALVNMLLEKGAKILVGDLKPIPTEWKGLLDYRHGDLNAMSKEEIDAFAPEIYFHLAATFERSVESFDFWGENFHHNVLLSHHLLTLLKDSKTLKKIIFASSYLIYDPKLYLTKQIPKKCTPLKEEAKIQPRNLCGMAKLMHEEELSFITHFRKDLQTISARIFRSYGKKSRDIISRWIKALKANEPITIYGKESLFDYIFADDVAKGLILLAESDYNGIVNLGSGNSRSIEDVVDILTLRFPTAKKIYEDVNQEALYESSQADMELFQKITGWKGFRSLEAGIDEIIKEQYQEKT